MAQTGGFGQRVVVSSVILVGWYCANAAFAVLAKQELSTSPRQRSAPFDLTFTQLVVGALAGVVYEIVRYGGSGGVTHRAADLRRDRVTRMTALAVGCLHMLGGLLTNVGYSLNRASTTQVVKAAEPMITVTLLFVVCRKRSSAATCFAVGLIGAGIVVFTVGDFEVSLEGVGWTVLASICLPLRNILGKQMNSAMGNSINTFVLSTWVACGIYVPLYLLYSWWSGDDVIETVSSFLRPMIPASLCYTAYNTFSFLFLGFHSPVSHSVANGMKRVSSIMLLMLVDSPGRPGAVIPGLGLLFTGLGMYTQQKSETTADITLQESHLPIHAKSHGHKKQHSVLPPGKMIVALLCGLSIVCMWAGIGRGISVETGKLDSEMETTTADLRRARWAVSRAIDRRLHLVGGRCQQNLPWYHWQPSQGAYNGRNVGDYVNTDLAKAILRRNASDDSVRVTADPNQPKLLGVGSVLHFANPGDVVVGAGWNFKVPFDDKYKNILPKINFVSVRGPVTQRLLAKAGVAVSTNLFGDPALYSNLILDLNVSRKRPYDLCVVPHARDILNNKAVRFINSHDKILLVPTNLTVYDFVFKLSQCQLVLSSALHGIIFADAIQVPSLWWRKPTASEKPGKYYDYFAGIGRPSASVQTMDDALGLVGTLRPRFDLHEIVRRAVDWINIFPVQTLCKSNPRPQNP